MQKPLNYLEISSNNLISNVQFFREILSPQTKIVSVIKANAYGHGLKEVAQILENYVDYFQVDDIEELRELRKVSLKPTFVLGYVQSSEIEELINLKGILGIYSLQQVEKIEKSSLKLNTRTKVHLCIDSALGRDGLLLDALEKFIEKISNFKNIILEGIYSHFANIEDTPDFSHAQKQIELYEKALNLFNKYGYNNLVTHISSTAGALVYESISHKNSLIRLGIGQYGLWPSKYLFANYINHPRGLKPVLKWVSHIAQIKTLPSGSTIGYGLTYTTTHPTKIAIIPQGYSDGYDRGLSNEGEVLIQGQKCRILGRISMNMMTVDITHLNEVNIEDEVVLIGYQGEKSISVDYLADKIGTINYEIIARINPNLARHII